MTASLAVDASIQPVIAGLGELVESDIPHELAPILAGALLARLKYINRTANGNTKAHRQATAESRVSLNETDLSNQNLMYEKRHLEREIEKCRQFASTYQDIPLHSVEEFKRLAPEEDRTPEILENEHEVMLRQLNFELAERTRLEHERRSLITERDQVRKETQEYIKHVDALAVRFDNFAKETMEIQKMIQALTPAQQPSES